MLSERHGAKAPSLQHVVSHLFSFHPPNLHASDGLGSHGGLKHWLKGVAPGLQSEAITMTSPLLACMAYSGADDDTRVLLSYRGAGNGRPRNSGVN